MEPVKLDLSQMSRIDKYILGSTFYNALIKHFENPVNRERFEKWQKEKGKQLKF